MSFEDLTTLGADTLPSMASSFHAMVHYDFSKGAPELMSSSSMTELLIRSVREGLLKCYAEALKRGPIPETALSIAFNVASSKAAPLVSLKGSSSDPKLQQCSAKVIQKTPWPKNHGLKAGTTPELPILFFRTSSFSPERYVITRLHARYGKESLGEDLVFRAAPPLSGGQEVRDASGKLNQGAVLNMGMGFQGRYAIRHPWTGPVACESPVRGVWGPPPGTWQLQAKSASNTAFAPRGGVNLLSLVKEDVPEIGLLLPAAAPSPLANQAAPDDKGSPLPAATAPAAKPAASPLPPLPPPSGGCAACAVPAPREAREGDSGASGGAASGLSAAAAVLCAALRRLRRGRVTAGLDEGVVELDDLGRRRAEVPRLAEGHGAEAELRDAEPGGAEELNFHARHDA
jgi:hypothetical protein